MKYENAGDILPGSLLRELQRYAAGRLLYVPLPGARRPWGVNSGSRRQLDERNGEIRKRFAGGDSVDALAEAYFLTSETIKKIVYQKKERITMEREIEELLKRYTDEKPIEAEIVAEGPVSAADDGPGYYLELAVTTPSGRLTLHVCDYAFATPARIAQAAAVIQAYRSLGYPCPRILPTLGGELSGKVHYKAHDCLVFAQEYAGETYLSGYPAADGLPPYNDELLLAAAETASLHLEGGEPSAFALFEPLTACGDRYEDYTAEYVYGDLKEKVMECCPSLLGRYERIEKRFAENRAALRGMWERLPASLFHGELCEICVDGGGHFRCFKQFLEGGREACIGYFIRLVFFLNGKVHRIANGCAEVYDAAQRKNRLEAFARDFRILAEHYRFTDEEIEAAPLIYRNQLLGTCYYWDVIEFADGEESRLADFLDYLEGQLTCEEIDFAAIMR